jgi:hypothetical protein
MANIKIWEQQKKIIIIIQFFIIYVPSQQPQGQLQEQHSVDKKIILWTNTT